MCAAARQATLLSYSRTRIVFSFGKAKRLMNSHETVACCIRGLPIVGLSGTRSKSRWKAKGSTSRLEPHEFRQLKEWVGPPRHSDLIFALTGLEWGGLTAMLFSSEAISRFQTGRFGFGNIPNFVRAVSHSPVRFGTVSSQPWLVCRRSGRGASIFRLWLGSYSPTDFSRLGCVLGLVMLFHVWQDHKNFKDFRWVEPDGVIR